MLSVPHMLDPLVSQLSAPFPLCPPHLHLFLEGQRSSPTLFYLSIHPGHSGWRDPSKLTPPTHTPCTAARTRLGGFLCPQAKAKLCHHAGVQRPTPILATSMSHSPDSPDSWHLSHSSSVTPAFPLHGTLFLKIYFNYVNVYVSVYRYMHVSTGTCGGQRHFLSLDLERKLHNISSGNKLRSSARAVSSLNL